MSFGLRPLDGSSGLVTMWIKIGMVEVDDDDEGDAGVKAAACVCRDDMRERLEGS